MSRKNTVVQAYNQYLSGVTRGINSYNRSVAAAVVATATAAAAQAQEEVEEAARATLWETVLRVQKVALSTPAVAVGVIAEAHRGIHFQHVSGGSDISTPGKCHMPRVTFRQAPRDRL